jgi:hypothetical protein
MLRPVSPLVDCDSADHAGNCSRQGEETWFEFRRLLIHSTKRHLCRCQAASILEPDILLKDAREPYWLHFCCSFRKCGTLELPASAGIHRRPRLPGLISSGVIFRNTSYPPLAYVVTLSTTTLSFTASAAWVRAPSTSRRVRSTYFTLRQGGHRRRLAGQPL